MYNNTEINEKIKNYSNLIQKLEERLIEEFDKEDRNSKVVEDLHGEIEHYCRKLELIKRRRKNEGDQVDL